MPRTNNSASSVPFHGTVCAGDRAAQAADPNPWRIRYRQSGEYRVEGFESSDAAMEAACRLLDHGSEVVGLAAAMGEIAVDREHLALIYAAWVRARYH